MTIGKQKVKFGYGQWKKPTPAKIVFWVKVYTIFTAAFTVSMESLPVDLSVKTESWIHWIIGFTTAVANGVSPLFGVDIESKKVPTEDVVVVDAPKKE